MNVVQFEAWWRAGRKGVNLKKLTQTAYPKFLRHFTTEFKKYVLGQITPNNEVKTRNISVGIGNKEFDANTTAHVHVAVNGSNELRDQLAALGDLPESFKEHFMCISLGLRPGETEESGENTVKAAVMSILNLVIMVDGRRQAKNMMSSMIVPEFSYKVANGKIYIFVSSDPQLVLMSLGRREFIPFYSIYNTIFDITDTEMTADFKLTGNFCPLKLVEHPTSVFTDLLLDSLKLQGSTKIWKDAMSLVMNIMKVM